MNRLPYLRSFVRFSHSVFALPFALTGALLRRAARSPVDAGGASAGFVVAMVAARSAAMGFNRLVDARIDALNPRTAMRELPRGAMTRARGDASSSSSRRWCSSSPPGGWARSASRCRRSRWRSCSGIRWRSASPPTRSCFSAWRWRWRRSAAGWPPAAAAAGSRGCSRSRSAPGSAASTSSMPARISTSIAPTACARFRCASACRRSLAISRAMHVVAVVCLLALALGRAARTGLSRRRRRRRGAARLRAVAGARRRSVAGEARLRSERLRRHPVPRWCSRSAIYVR